MKTAQQDLKQQYQFLKKLGHGAFGHIISVRSYNNGKVYACKIEKNLGRKRILVQKEFQILTQLLPSKKFPLVYSIKKFQENSYIIMEELDKSLSNIMSQLKNPFSIKTISLIFEQLITSFEILHRTGYLHRDLKAQNIMTCINSHNIKLIDFGLADVVSVRRSVSLIGNVRFASRGAHLGFSSKMDDLQEMIFVIYYLMLGKLPWQNASNQDIHKEMDRDITKHELELTPIYTMKLNFLKQMASLQTKNLIKQAFYQELHSIASYIFRLKRQDEPDYRLLIHKADRLMMIAGTSKGECYDWCPSNCTSRQPYSQFWSVFQK